MVNKNKIIKYVVFSFIIYSILEIILAIQSSIEWLLIIFIFLLLSYTSLLIYLFLKDRKQIIRNKN